MPKIRGANETTMPAAMLTMANRSRETPGKSVLVAAVTLKTEATATRPVEMLVAQLSPSVQAPEATMGCRSRSRSKKPRARPSAELEPRKRARTRNTDQIRVASATARPATAGIPR